MSQKQRRARPPETVAPSNSLDIFNNGDSIERPQTIQEIADRFVREMMAIGAVFGVSRSGHAAELSWTYESPPGRREDLRGLKANFDLTAPGMNFSVCKAVMRLKFTAGAP